MKIHRIVTQTDYQAALAEASSLMDAGVGTPEGDRLDVLVSLIEAYEAQHYPVEMTSSSQ
jgi:HTH-type transcriptional regulator / antitoxin HigA